MKNKLLTIIFLLLVFGITLLDLLSPDRDFSEWENRELKKMPKATFKTVFDGSFGVDYESYMTDQFALRDTLVKVKYLSDRVLLKTDAGGVYIGDDALFVKQKAIDRTKLQKNITAMEAFAKEYPARFLLVPSATYALRDKLPPYASVTDEKALFDELESSFENIQFINLVSDFDGSELYFRTDHHWTAEGALVGYNAYRKAIGETPLTKDDFVVSVVSDDFLGTSVSKSGALGITPDTLEKWERGQTLSVGVYDGFKLLKYDSIYFDEYLLKKDKYSYYLGQNESLVRIKTGSEGGRLLVFKDSYAHIFSQLMLADYSEIVLVDLRYVREKVDVLLERTLGEELSDFDEFLFLYSVDTFTTESNMLWLK